jgi:uncharacterized protein
VAKFKIHAKRKNGDKTEEAILFYDNMTSELTWENGKQIYNEEIRKKNANRNWKTALVTTPENPLGKKSTIKTLKIQLGLSCNYSCEYCSQRFVPHSDETNSKYVDKFVKNLDSWLEGEPKNIEFWGGEPMVYIKTIKPLAEKLRKKYPNARFGLITNGSLLNPEINEWIDKMGFGVGISHDGPGQPVRGPDPLEDPKSREGIIDLFHRLGPQGRISFNTMMNRENMDRGAVQKFFGDFLRSIGIKEFNIGEGGFIDPYDEGGLANSLKSEEEHIGFRRITLNQTKKVQNYRFSIVRQRTDEWIQSISALRPASALGQKCGMDDIETIAVDLRGNVITCQNVSAVATAPNGKSHMIGHVSQLDKVKLKTSTHWSARKECVDCPVLQVCKGACMYLQGHLWENACENAYTDHIPFWAAGIEKMTGFLPYYIEHESLPERRKNIWGNPDQKIVVPKTRQKATELNTVALGE